jgi:hypothetical protein
MGKSNPSRVSKNVIGTIRKSSTSVTPPLGTQYNQNDSQRSSLDWMKAMATFASAGFILGQGVMNTEDKTKCCGIVGVVGTKEHDAR